MEGKKTTKKHQNDEKETQRREHERVKASHLLSVVCQASRCPSLSLSSAVPAPHVLSVGARHLKANDTLMTFFIKVFSAFVEETQRHTRVCLQTKAASLQMMAFRANLDTKPGWVREQQHCLHFKGMKSRKQRRVSIR